MIKGMGHVGLVVKDIDKTVATLCSALSIPQPKIKDSPELKLKVAMINLGGVAVEVLEDYSEDGDLAQCVREKGDTIQHFCLLSDDIEADIEALEKRGVEMIDRKPRVGIRGKKIAFAAQDFLDGITMELSEP